VFKEDGNAFKFASERLKDDKDYILATVNKNGNALQ
jgi:hypothetical protein